MVQINELRRLSSNRMLFFGFRVGVDLLNTFDDCLKP